MKATPTVFAGLLCLAAVTAAGDSEKSADEPAVSPAGDWCESLPWDAGQIVDAPASPWLQSLRVGGLMHLESGAVAGRADGRGFWYDRGLEWRRLRLTMQAKALGVFDVVAQANMVEDEGCTGGDLDFGYSSLFHAWVELDLRKVFGVTSLDRFSVAYGKRKLHELAEIVDTGVSLIEMVEYPFLGSFLSPYPNGVPPTGAWINAAHGADTFSLGVYSSDSAPEFASWNEGWLVVGSWRRDFTKTWGLDRALVSLGAAYQDADPVSDVCYSPWRWTLTPWMRVGHDRWDLRVSAAGGDLLGPSATTGGAFFGINIMPSWWLVEGTLQAVASGGFARSRSPQGLRLPVRYARAAGLPDNEDIPLLANGRGDLHLELYGGLVWWVCPKHWSVLSGVQWENMRSQGSDVYEGTTLWFSTRVFF